MDLWRTGKPRPLDPTNYDDVVVPSDSFTFRKVWQGDREGSIDYTLYRKGGEVFRHDFSRQTLSADEWRYKAWFTTPTACYVIEKPVSGYVTTYANVGVYEKVTDRCCDGGTIINTKIPQTGDKSDLRMWMGLLGISAAWGVILLIFGLKQRQKRK